MTKQLIALALAAAFGIAHAADAKPASDAKPAAVKVAADTTKPDGGVGSATAPSKAEGTTTADAPRPVKKARHHKKMHKKTAKGEAMKAEPATPATPAEPAKK